MEGWPDSRIPPVACWPDWHPPRTAVAPTRMAVKQIPGRGDGARIFMIHSIFQKGANGAIPLGIRIVGGQIVDAGLSRIFVDFNHHFLHDAK